MITCPACGKENEDSAFECKRCRAPLREDVPEEHHEAPAAEAEPVASSESLGEVCRRCETFNEPGVRVCTNCGYELFADALAEAAAEPPMDKTPPQAYAPQHEEATPPEGNASLSDELSALALSDEEAAEAGVSTSGNGHEEPPMDRTPEQPYAAPEPVPTPPPAPRAKVAEVAAAAAGVAVGAAAGLAAAATRRAPPAEPPPLPPPPVPARAPEPPAAPAEKHCANCGAGNPPAAKFCFDCGTPFAKKAPPAPEVPKAPPMPPPPKIEPVKMVAEPPPSIQVEPELSESTAESMPVEEPLPEELPAESVPPEEPLPEEMPAEEALPEEALPEEPQPLEEPLPEEQPPAEEALPPFQATLLIEKGAGQGTAFMLAHLENTVGGAGAHVELEDPYTAPHAATLLFAEDHLVLRDEGSANGVFVKVRESAPIEPGDSFVAGQRLFRYDGPQELPRGADGETPFLGAPRPQGTVVRVTEVLQGGKTGRTCHRAGPVIAIGRTGCDMNFPADEGLAAKHAEIRLAEDGSATLVDLGAAPGGVFLRVRAQGQQDLQAGDLVLVGEQQLRVEVS